MRLIIEMVRFLSPSRSWISVEEVRLVRGVRSKASSRGVMRCAIEVACAYRRI